VPASSLGKAANEPAQAAACYSPQLRGLVFLPSLPPDDRTVTTLRSRPSAAYSRHVWLTAIVCQPALTDRGQTGPLVVLLQSIDISRDHRRAGFDAAMMGVDGGLAEAGSTCRVVEKPAHVVM
jgi:hypothetical protein